jgi:uncharacterized protein (TIGR02466 family)
MVGAQPRLTSQFAVPVLETYLPGCEPLNRELEALFLAREAEPYRNPMPSHVPQQELFESRFNLFRWPEPCIQRLRTFMLDGVVQTVLRVTDLTAADLARLKFHNHTWFHITRHAGSFVAHNHPMASWSAVYCVRPGASPAEAPGSGLLRLFDPRTAAGAYRDPATERLQGGFRAGAVELRLAAGQLIVFPSYLVHEVSPFFGDDTRITVATNCWFAS